MPFFFWIQQDVRFRDKYAAPKQWVSIMKNSIADLTPVFNTQRMVLEYLHKYYR